MPPIWLIVAGQHVHVIDTKHLLCVRDTKNVSGESCCEVADDYVRITTLQSTIADRR